MRAPHYFAGSSRCLYCSAPGNRTGEPCAARAAREAEHVSSGPYDPVRALGAAVFGLAWPHVGAYRLERDDAGHGTNGTTRFRVMRGDELVAEGEAVGVEAAARVVREILESRLNAKRSTRVSNRDHTERACPKQR